MRLTIVLTLCLSSVASARCRWSFFEAYVEHFISSGRVIDDSANSITTSEGQSYALFFALVNGDRALFDELLAWTNDNLAGGQLGARLPAYKWGHRADGPWNVLDDNSAADSDLWLSYVLTEAGRLWRDESLSKLGRALAGQVITREVAMLPGLGAMLLPAPRGFVHRRSYRLNPSYLPIQLLDGMEAEGVRGPWRELRVNALRLIAARARHGFVDDWVGYRAPRGFSTDPTSGAIGSYDAIRVYLWAALSNAPDRDALLNSLDGPKRHWRVHGYVPERIDTIHPKSGRAGPVGFLAVLLPALRDPAAIDALTKAIERQRHGSLYGHPPRYYDQNLILFAQGALQGRYRFDSRGRLQPAWATQHCPTVPP
jgi:endoglucanase